MPLTPATRLGPYEIIAPLGAGGMGEVYRATAPNLRLAPTRPEARTTLEARKRFSDQRRPPEQKTIVGRTS